VKRLRDALARRIMLEFARPLVYSLARGASGCLQPAWTSRPGAKPLPPQAAQTDSHLRHLRALFHLWKSRRPSPSK
jgi:hypothetical protein